MLGRKLNACMALLHLCFVELFLLKKRERERERERGRERVEYSNIPFIASEVSELD